MPTIFPHLVAMPLGEASPGDLVRTTTFSGTSLAFVACEEGRDARHLVMLSGDGGNQPEPPYAILNVDQEEQILSYGQNYRIDLDTSEEHIHVGYVRQAEIRGAIGIRGAERLLRVGPQLTGRPRTFWYDMEGGIFRSLQNTNICYVTAWTLGLEVPWGAPPMLLARFVAA
ncbi:hypothetical protein [Indioceanicola profundi]|uniref:hypothetical protein n=1 Tax=Indioceanicola profundi TaxID=2220096 RepID=UPI0013C4AB41|nr:hypothetical protein [Indioceanicola profundi]